MIFKTLRITTLSLGITIGLSANAVGLNAEEGWKFKVGGFLELDTIYDTTRGFSETLGNSPVNKQSTVKGDLGQTQFSVRHSRLSLTVNPPAFESWKIKSYLELDFMGYNPSPSTTAPTNSEASFYSAPTMRLRHGYVQAESGPWTVTVGQTWSFFGLNPAYVLSTVSPSPVAGTIYQRTPQINVIRDFELGGEKNKLQAGLALARPTQRDSTYPNLDAGVRIFLGERKSAFATSSGDLKMQTMNFALTSTLRSFASTAAGDSSTKGLTRYYGQGVSLAGFLPVKSNLTITSEFAWGAGIGDSFTGWTGNLAQMTSTNSTSTSPTLNLDSGLGALDSSGNFTLAQLQSFNAQIQYHFSEDKTQALTLGYGQVYFLNSGVYPTTAASTGNVLYDRPDCVFINYFQDITPQWRWGVEYSRSSTHYTDGNWASNNRFETNFWLRL